jgi:hypothetical protein
MLVKKSEDDPRTKHCSYNNTGTYAQYVVCLCCIRFQIRQSFHQVKSFVSQVSKHAPVNRTNNSTVQGFIVPCSAPVRHSSFVQFFFCCS